MKLVSDQATELNLAMISLHGLQPQRHEMKI